MYNRGISGGGILCKTKTSEELYRLYLAVNAMDMGVYSLRMQIESLTETIKKLEALIKQNGTDKKDI